jgi:hypothetical protein
MPQRTDQQNRALHLFFKLLADTLNDAGLDQRKVLKPGIEIPWTGETIKEQLWRPIQELYLKKRSTTELDTKDINNVYEVLNRHLAEKFGIHEPFPSLDELIYQEEQKGKL